MPMPMRICCREMDSRGILVWPIECRGLDRVRQGEEKVEGERGKERVELEWEKVVPVVPVPNEGSK